MRILLTCFDFTCYGLRFQRDLDGGVLSLGEEKHCLGQKGFEAERGNHVRNETDPIPHGYFSTRFAVLCAVQRASRTKPGDGGATILGRH